MKMKFYSLLFVLFFLSASISYASNPFQAPSKTTSAKKMTTSAPNAVYFKLAMAQKKLRTRLSSMMKEVKKTGSFLPLFPLVLIAFVYGIVHAAGPGHGKALAVSYLVSRGRKALDGFYVGSFIAILHGISAICLVLFLKFILNKSIMGPLEDITWITKITSYSFILGIGIILTIKNLYGWYQNMGVRRDHYSGKYATRPTGSLSTALAVGMIPCPGTVLIMLFALSINMIGIGIILAAAQTLGMALTISVIGTIVVAIKSKTLSTLDYTRRDLADTFEKIVETLAGVMIIVVGGFLLMHSL